MESDRGEGDSPQKVMPLEQRADHRAMLLVALMAAAAFFGGYGLHVWESWGTTSAYEWCLTHRIVENGRVYCDVTSYGQSQAD